MRKFQLCLLALTAVFATGCPNEPSKNFSRSGSLVNNINERLTTYQAAYNQAITNNPTEAQRQRNDALELAVAIIDDNYNDYIKTLNSRRARNDFIADVIDLGTSAAVGIVKGERANQILGIGLTAFRGGRTKAELEFYKQQTVPILITKMDDNRAQVLSDILLKKSKPVTAYSMNEAIRDIVGYFNAGTLVRAFTQLSKDTAAQAKKSEEDLADIKRNPFVLGAPTKEEVEVSTANRASIDKVADQYAAEKKKVEDNDKRIADANKKIDDADKTIADESAKPNPVQSVIDAANADKAAANQTKTQATAARGTAITARDTAVTKLKAMYQAIADDAVLSPLLDQIPGLPGYSDKFRETLRAALQRAKDNEATGDDYALILKQINRIVVRNLTKDPTLNERLQSILAATNK
jgi:hypothetical protein